MLELENRVCNLELSKKLEELGVKQNSAWYWENYNLTAYGYRKLDSFELTDKLCIEDEVDVIGLKEPKDYEHYSTFTVAELGEILPKDKSYSIKRLDGKWECNHIYCVDPGTGDDVKSFQADTEADARAKMLIYLLENKLISLEEVNKGL